MDGSLAIEDKKMEKIKSIFILFLFAIILLGSSSTISGLSQHQIFATNGIDIVPVQIDKSTRAITTIDYSHHEIHAGSHYHLSYCNADLDSGQNLDILIITPNTSKYSHMIFSVTGTLITTVTLGEDATTSANGTLLTSYNSNRNSANVSGMAIYHTPTVTGTGTTIWQSTFGISSGTFVREGGDYSHDNEMILKKNAKYLFRANSGTNDNRVCWHFDWYEHTDK
jgi:hypothetical protein